MDWAPLNLPWIQLRHILLSISVRVLEQELCLFRWYLYITFICAVYPEVLEQFSQWGLCN